MLKDLFKPCPQLGKGRCCKIWTTSNLLTISRIIAIPFLMYGIMTHQWPLVFILFICTAATDLLDGYFARLSGEPTHLGALLDPLADKLFIFSSFAALAFWQSPSFKIPWWFVLIILLRESLMLLGGLVLLSLKKEELLSPTIWGKLTTFFQILFIVWIFICYFFGWVPAKTYSIILLLLTLSSFISFLHYLSRVLRAALFQLKQH